MNDIQLNAILLSQGRAIRSDLRAGYRDGFNVRSGKLQRSFKEKIFKTREGDTIGLSFELPRYGYILNHGVKSKSVKSKTGMSYTTKGFSGTGYIGKAIDPHIDKISEAVSALYGSKVDAAVRF